MVLSDLSSLAAIVLLLAAVVLLLMLLRKATQTEATVLGSRLGAFEKTLERIERAVKEEVAQSRGWRG